jgi:hypothetical protein
MENLLSKLSQDLQHLGNNLDGAFVSAGQLDRLKISVDGLEQDPHIGLPFW